MAHLVKGFTLRLPSRFSKGNGVKVQLRDTRGKGVQGFFLVKDFG